MKTKILIYENNQNKDKILNIIKNNIYLKNNCENISFYNQNTWFEVFNQVKKEYKQEHKFERIVIFADKGILSYFFFTKKLGFTTANPVDEERVKLSRAHNNANTLILTNYVSSNELDHLINLFFETPFEGGRHATRCDLMQKPYKKSNITYKFDTNSNNKTIVLASDHAGYDLKVSIKRYLIDQGYKVIDVGCDSIESTHYPLYAIALVKNANKAFCGLAFCSTGVGISNTINKFKGIRCFNCVTQDQVKIARSQLGANVLAIGAKFINYDECVRMVDEFIKTKSNSNSEINKIDELGYDFDREEFNKIPLTSNIVIPKELK